jgi:flagella basal body P-ring formation protein FlgA
LIGNTTIGVRCNGDNPWTIYVPTYVKAMHKVVITTRPILRRSTISKDDIRLEERDITASTDTYIDNPEDALGMLAKRDLAGSMVLTANMLAAPLLVHRGQQVVILAEGPGLEVRMGGIALMDGTEGQIIRAKNKLSKKMVEGRVIQPGIIKVNM